MAPSTENVQFHTFKDCLARRILACNSLASSQERIDEAEHDEAEALDEFSSYLATEVWPTLPLPLHTAAHDTPPPADLLDRLDTDDDSDCPDALLSNLPAAVSDSLITFGLVLDWESARKLVLTALQDYIHEATAPPPVWSSTRARCCELCEREVPLTYHHLIPRSTHDKARKRKWHPESMLNSVAWLCRCVLTLLN